GAALGFGQRFEARDDRAEGLSLADPPAARPLLCRAGWLPRLAALSGRTTPLTRQENLGSPNHPQGVRLALLRRRSPGGDAVAAQDAADRPRVRLLDRRDVQTQLEPGPPPRDPHDRVAEALGCQLLPV